MIAALLASLALAQPTPPPPEAEPPPPLAIPAEALPTDALPAEAALAVPAEALPVEPTLPEAAAPPEPPPPRRPVAPSCRAEAVYPDADWVLALDQPDPTAQAALDLFAFPRSLDWSDKDRRGTRTDALLVIHHGQIIYERYDQGYAAQRRHLSWSMAKTFGGVLTGIAVGEGRLDPEESICAHFSAPEAACAVRVKDLLEMASGFDWRESYEGLSPTASSVIAMLYGEGQADMASFLANQPLRDPPGTAYAYSTGDANLLSGVVHAVMAPIHGEDYPESLLLRPIGMGSALFERDPAGTPIAGSYVWATPRDFARFGLLLREDGCWQGERVVPEGWIDQMSQVGPAIKNKTYARDEDDVHGSQLWLNQPLPERGLTELPWPHAPQDTVVALGHWGQMIAAIPSLDLVVVRLADDRDAGIDRDHLLGLAIALAGEGPPPGPAREPRGPAADNSPIETIQKYDTPLFRIATAVKARWTCSCRFVLERDAGFCKEWTRVSPNIARVYVDVEAKTVQSTVLGFVPSTARYLGPALGCQLDPP